MKLVCVCIWVNERHLKKNFFFDETHLRLRKKLYFQQAFLNSARYILKKEKKNIYAKDNIYIL